MGTLPCVLWVELTSLWCACSPGLPVQAGREVSMSLSGNLRDIPGRRGLLPTRKQLLVSNAQQLVGVGYSDAMSLSATHSSL